MQTINKKTAIAVLLIAISTTLSSFSFNRGGDKMEIYINNKLVVEHFISHTKGSKTVTLYPGNYTNKVDVYYSHCGQTGKSRSLIVKDKENKIIKKWQFPDATGSNAAMSFIAKDIMDLQKNNQTVQLFYSSKELPDGKLLATVVMANSNYAKVQ